MSNEIPDINHNARMDWNRDFFTVEAKNGNMSIGKITLNIPERIVRILFHWAGAYKNTFLTSEEVTLISQKYNVPIDSPDKPLYQQI